jgi:hypothetical protein
MDRDVRPAPYCALIRKIPAQPLLRAFYKKKLIVMELRVDINASYLNKTTPSVAYQQVENPVHLTLSKI